MNIFRCKDCNKKQYESEVVLTINSAGEWTLHCNTCNSNNLELANEISGGYDNEIKKTQHNK